MSIAPGWDNTYARDLADFVVPFEPDPAPSPQLLLLNSDVVQRLGPAAAALSLADLSGRSVPTGASPVALAYAGHQFGGFSPMLGDGRAVLLGELISEQGVRYDVAMKGSGRTPFARGGDGKAHVAAVVREYLIGEALWHLGIPTTRALAVLSTGETIQRETPRPGGLLVRTASSHLRVGTFELVRARGTLAQLEQLAQYAIRRHDPALLGIECGPERARAFLFAVAERQAELIAAWMSIGFVHGVMNTDNVSISGEAIDFGPCAFLERYDPDAVFSSIDTAGRYRYAAQPEIGAWNIARFAEAILPLLSADPTDTAAGIAVATPVLEHFQTWYRSAWLARFRAKLGLTSSTENQDQDQEDHQLIEDLLALMHAEGLDFTQTWRQLAEHVRGRGDDVRGEVLDLARFDAWSERWSNRLGDEPNDVVAERMDAVNPLHVARNHLVEQALRAAEEGDISVAEELLVRLGDPYGRSVTEPGTYTEPADPEWSANYQTFCGT